jgi:hypothetical protein
MAERTASVCVALAARRHASFNDDSQRFHHRQRGMAI